MRSDRVTLAGAIAFAALAPVSCALLDGVERGTFRGTYVSAFEASSFVPCGGSNSWWLEDASGTLHSQLPPFDSLSFSRAAYIVVAGRRSSKGQFGHLGSYDYALTVTSVVSVSPDTSGACQ
jgi:hypothetical protein